jgi:hypothetical protein
VLLATGDGDFVQVVNALQNRGCRVEVVAFENVSTELKLEADMYMSGYLVPGLLPTPAENGGRWGEIDSRVRGTCYYFNQAKGFGFFRFMKTIGPALWDVDSRKPGSPYRSVFFHESELPTGIRPADLPSREQIFEFDLVKSSRVAADDEQTENMQAVKIQLARNGS